MQDKKGFLALLFNGVILGTYGIWVRLLQHTLTGYQQVIARSIVSFALAVIILLLLQGTWKIHKKHNKQLFIYLLCFAISTILFTLAALQTTIALSVFGLYVGSILTAFILGFLFFNEKITPGKLVSILLVIGALVAFIYPFSAKFSHVGLLLGIGSGITDGIGSAFKKYFGGKIDRPILIVLQLLSTLLVALLLTIFAHQGIITEPFSFITVIVVLIYGAIFVSSSYLSLFGFQHFDLNLGTIIVSSELFFAPFFAFLFFKETLTSYEIIGGILIAMAIIIPYIKLRSLFKINVMKYFM